MGMADSRSTLRATSLQALHLLDDPRALIGTVPIDGGADDIRDDPEFSGLETEFRKMETAGPAAVDWPALNRQTVEAIERRSKDLVLATRLVYGLYREEGYRGLAVGTAILRDMVAQQWDRLYPPPGRERGRAGSFAWLAEKLAPAIEARTPSPAEGPFARMALDDLAQLDRLLASHFIKFPVTLGPLTDALETHLRAAVAAETHSGTEPRQRKTRKAKQPRSAEEATAAALPDHRQNEDAGGADGGPAAEPRPAEEQAEGAQSGKAELDQPAEAKAADPMRATFSAAAQAAAVALAVDARDAQAYLAARFAAWGPIRLAPPASGGVTALPPPDKALVKRIAGLNAGADVKDLALACEEALCNCPLWLESQFILMQGLEAAGPDYAAARAVVIAELAAFLQRVTGLLDLSFRDGTAFAGPQALAWIRQSVLSGAEDGIDRLKMVAAEAGRLGRSGAVLQGLRLLADHADQAADARRRFAARIELGEYCLKFKLLRPLYPLLDDLQTIAKERAIESWEPQLAGSLLSLSWRAYSHREAGRHVAAAELEERKALIVATLARIDVAKAAELSCSAQA